jgi:hypothetical protein
VQEADKRAASSGITEHNRNTEVGKRSVPKYQNTPRTRKIGYNAGEQKLYTEN